MKKTYNLFLSHSWTYGNSYEKLVCLLDRDDDFLYRNYYVPKDAPIYNVANEKQLHEVIKNQMKYANAVLILAGVDSTYGKWINKEIEIARTEFYAPKKIIVIEPWGLERTSPVLKKVADKIVGWNRKSIIDAISDVC